MGMRYAVVELSTGTVVNVIEWDGQTEWEAPEGSMAVESDTANIGWSYTGGAFAASPVTPSSPEVVKATNASYLDLLQAKASQSMTPLLISLQLGEASPSEVALAQAWQAYSRALKDVDLNEEMPAWPNPPT